MAGVLDGIDRRTQMVGENRLELLLFRLHGSQTYGINVFKVQEVIRCPKLTVLPSAHYTVRGVSNIRGKTIPVIDLSHALGGVPIAAENMDDSFVIIADYNRSIQGFLVAGVERIVNMNWVDILAPPTGAGVGTYLTAVTHLDDKLVEIIDVEKVLDEISGLPNEVSDEVLQGTDEKDLANKHVLVVDDSSVARRQIKKTLDQIGVQCTLAKDGKEALGFLLDLAEDDTEVTESVALVISDVEMPIMDGYTLTTEIRKHDNLRNLYVILHTSLSGVFNQAMVEKVGANEFIPKFDPNELATSVLKVIETNVAKKHAA